MGEPMKVMEAGRFGSSSSAIIEIAASTGGPGWQTASTCAPGPTWLIMLRTWSDSGATIRSRGRGAAPGLRAAASASGSLRKWTRLHQGDRQATDAVTGTGALLILTLSMPQSGLP